MSVSISTSDIHIANSIYMKVNSDFKRPPATPLSQKTENKHFHLHSDNNVNKLTFCPHSQQTQNRTRRQTKRGSLVILNEMIQLAPRHLPLKCCDSTWECGDLGLITHLWWERGGQHLCWSTPSYSHRHLGALWLRSCLFTRIFHESFTPAVNFSSHFVKADSLSRVVFFTLLFIEPLERKEEVSYVH